MSLRVVAPGEVRRLVPVAATHHPDPADRAVYDQLSAEFPKLYSAQRRTFARLRR
jgi:sugar (pentulose or hexulose) kinase